MVAFLLSVPLHNPLFTDLDQATADAYMWWTGVATIILVAGLIGIGVGLSAPRVRRFWHRHFTADGRQMARRLQEIAR